MQDFSKALEPIVARLARELAREVSEMLVRTITAGDLGSMVRSAASSAPAKGTTLPALPARRRASPKPVVALAPKARPGARKPSKTAPASVSAVSAKGPPARPRRTPAPAPAPVVVPAMVRTVLPPRVRTLPPRRAAGSRKPAPPAPVVQAAETPVPKPLVRKAASKG